MAEQREKERAEREAKERLEREERERVERDRKELVATRGGVRGVRGTRASTRGITRGTTRGCTLYLLKLIHPLMFLYLAASSRGGTTGTSTRGSGLATRGAVKRS